MEKNANNNLTAALVGLLVVVIAVQSAVLAKVVWRRDGPELKPVPEPVQMNLRPKTGAAQPPAAGIPKWDPSAPAWPYGGLGLDPGIWDPFKEFQGMRQQMDQMFNDSFGRFQRSSDFQSIWGATTFAPSMDMEEKDDAYVVRMDIPGTDKSKISVNIDDRQLVVSGKVDETIEEQGKNQLRKERRSGEFRRVLTLPGPVKNDEMEAEYENGVLVITVPKDKEEGRSLSIKIK